MSLPKNRKKLSGNKPTGKENPEEFPASNRDTESAEKKEKTPAYSARNKQMIKAFEIVEHMERINGITDIGEQKPASTSLSSSVNNQRSDNTKGFQVKVSFSPTPSRESEVHEETGKENTTMIEVKFKIPSFFRKVPVLKVITDSFIRRFAKE